MVLVPSRAVSALALEYGMVTHKIREESSQMVMLQDDLTILNMNVLNNRISK